MKQTQARPVSTCPVTTHIPKPLGSFPTPPLPPLPSMTTTLPLPSPPSPPPTSAIKSFPSLLAQTRPASLPGNLDKETVTATTGLRETTTPLPSTLTTASVTYNDLILANRGTPTQSLYPPLNPPLTLRSSAIAKLFPEDRPPSSTSSLKSTPPVSIAIPLRRHGKDSPNVKDLVRSFEDAGVLKGYMEKGKEKEVQALRRSHSMAGFRDAV